MHRCLELAALAAGQVAPNPLVGAVLVYEDRIIGEGYHQQYGQPHAEVNCIQSVQETDRHLISQSTMYVSLEPCAHFGKTPPCADLIIRNGIPKVVIGSRDPFKEVDGKGIEKLQAAGVEVITGALEQEATELNKRFFTFYTKHRPYIILKWAQTADGFIANEDYSRLQISNDLTNRLVHRWRSEEASILVGTNTALFDNPQLNTRHWPGANHIRLVVDMNLRLPKNLQIFNGEQQTIVFNTVLQEKQGNLQYYQVTKDVELVHQVMNALYQQKILSVLVEGGTQLLQSFIDTEYWDEIRIITNEQLTAGSGIKAPVLNGVGSVATQQLATDTIRTFRPTGSLTSLFAKS